MSNQRVNYKLVIAQHRWHLSFLGVVLLLSVVVLLAFVSRSRSGPITVDALSQRAQEFIANQQQSGNPLWRNKSTAVETPSVTTGSNIETDCFSFFPPFPIRSVEKVDIPGCLITVRVSSPPSRLTISNTQLSSSIAEHSAISMREVSTDTYQPINFTSEWYPPYKVFRDSQGVSYFSETDGRLLSVVFSETYNQEKIIAETLEQALSAISVKPQAEYQLEATNSNRLQ